jgi:hypothetical protein
MSLALSFLGGMAKRGMQRNDERREIDNRIELETKLTDMRLKAQARKESASRNASRSKQKEEAITMFQALGGGNVDQATLNYVTGLPAALQNSLLEKMQGPNAVDLNALIKMQTITGEDGTSSSPQFGINKEQFNKQYRVQQDTLAAEIDSFSLVYANSPTPENQQKLQQLIDVSKTINGKESLERMSHSTLISIRKAQQLQTGIAEEINGVIGLKRLDYSDNKAFGFLQDMSDTFKNEEELLLGGEKYSNNETINAHINNGKSIMDQHVNEVMSTMRNSGDQSATVPINSIDYYKYNNQDVYDPRATFEAIMEIASQHNNKMIDFVAPGQEGIQFTILVGDGGQGQFHMTTDTIAILKQMARQN